MSKALTKQAPATTGAGGPPAGATSAPAKPAPAKQAAAPDATRDVAAQTAPVAKAPGGSRLWLQGLLCGAVATLATSTAIVEAVLLLPTVVALLLDPRATRPPPRALLLVGLAMSIHPLLRLWLPGPSIAGAIAVLGDLRAVAAAWAAQAGMWLLAEGLPIIVRVTLDTRTAAQAAGLRARRARLESEWGTALVATEDSADANGRP